MQTVTGLYDNYDDASAVVSALEDAGISSSDISVVSRESDGRESNAGEGAAVGAGVGAVVAGTGGLLSGLDMLAIPGIGPVVAAGWLVSTVAGAAAGAAVGGAAGGIIGALTDSGTSVEDAHVYAETVRRGGTIVSARVEDDRADIARSIIDARSSVDVNARRSMYREEGWQGFDETRPDYSKEEIARERDRVRDYRSM